MKILKHNFFLLVCQWEFIFLNIIMHESKYYLNTFAIFIYTCSASKDNLDYLISLIIGYKLNYD